MKRRGAEKRIHGALIQALRSEKFHGETFGGIEMIKTSTVVAVSLIALGLVVVVVLASNRNKVTASNPTISTQTSAWGSLFNLGTAIVGTFKPDEKISPPAGTQGTYHGESFEDYVGNMFGPGTTPKATEA